MKTAISIPDALFEEADRVARRRGLSRSELYATAIAEYVGAERYHGVREQLDAVYATEPRASALDAGIERLQAQSLDQADW